MASQAYYQWVAAGRPYRLATPIVELRDRAYAAGVKVLGTIGNNDHLTASRPEDHTPFSATAWPARLTDYVVCAIDLADTDGLGGRVLADARAGRLPWLKYMNFNGGHYDSRDLDGDGIRWERSYSSDDHVHLSIRTDWVSKSVGTYNPFTHGGTVADLSIEDVQMIRNLHAIGLALARGEFGNIHPHVQDSPVNRWVRDTAAAVARIEAAVVALGGAAPVPPPSGTVTLTAADRAAIVADLVAALGAALTRTGAPSDPAG